MSASSINTTNNSPKNQGPPSGAMDQMYYAQVAALQCKLFAKKVPDRDQRQIDFKFANYEQILINWTHRKTKYNFYTLDLLYELFSLEMTNPSCVAYGSPPLDKPLKDNRVLLADPSKIHNYNPKNVVLDECEEEDEDPPESDSVVLERKAPPAFCLSEHERTERFPNDEEEVSIPQNVEFLDDEISSELLESIKENAPTSENSVDSYLVVGFQITAFVGNILTCKEWDQYLTATLSFLSGIAGKEVVAMFQRRRGIIKNEGSTEGIATLLDYIRSARTVTTTFFESPVYQFFIDTLGLAAIAGMCKGISIGSLEVVSSSFVAHTMSSTATDLPNTLLRAMEFSLEVLHRFTTGANLTNFIYGRGILQRCSELLSLQVDFNNGMMHKKHGMSPEEYHARIRSAMVALIDFTKTSVGTTKAIALSSMSKLMALEATVRTKIATTGYRKRPFCIMLFGPSGVGKSSITPKLFHAVGAVNGFATSPENVVEILDNEKYDPHTGVTNVVIFPDFNNAKKTEGLSELPCQKLRRMNDVVPTMAIKADVDEKHCIPINPSLIILGTNDWTLGAAEQSNDPQSIYNRVDVKLHVECYDYCRGPGGKLLPEKIRKDENGCPIMHLKAREMVYKVENGKVSKSFTGEWYDMNVMIAMLVRRAKLHAEQQERNFQMFQEQSRLQICRECCHFKGVCSCEKPDFCSPIIKNEGVITSAISTIVRTIRGRGNSADRVETGRAVLSVLRTCAFTTTDSLVIKKFLVNRFTCFATKMAWRFAGKFEFTILCSIMMYLCLWSALNGGMFILLNLFLIYLTYAIVYTSGRAAADIVAEQITDAYADGLPEMAVSLLDGVLYLPMALAAITMLRFTVRNVSFNHEGNLAPKSMFEIQQRNDEPTQWAEMPDVRSDVIASHKTKTTTWQDVAGLAQRHTYDVSVPTKDGRLVSCVANRVHSNWVILPKHSFKEMKTDEAMTFRTVGKKKVNSVFSKCRFDTRTITPVMKDHIAVVVDGLPDEGSMLDYFVDNPPLTKVEARIALRVPFEEMPSVLCKYDEYNMESGRLHGFGGHTIGSTSRGDCATPWIAVGTDNYILGLHNGRQNDFAVCEFIPRSALQFMLERTTEVIKHEGFEITVPISPPPPLLEIDTVCFGNDIYSSNEVHPKAACRFPVIKEERVPMYDVYGSAVSTMATQVSRVVPTKLSPFLEKEGLVQKWGKPPTGPIRNFAASFQAAQYPALSVDPTALSWAVLDYVCPMVEQIHKLGYYFQPLNMWEAFNGRKEQGINPMRMETSAGIGLPGKKLDNADVHIDPDTQQKSYTPRPEVAVEVARLQEKLKKRERCSPISKGSIKDEPTLIGKLKARIFFILPMCFLIIGRMLLCPVIAFIAANPLLSENWFGVRTTTEEWDQVYEHVNYWGGEHVMNGDYKSYDQTISTQLIWAVGSIFSILASALGYKLDSIISLETWFADIASPVYAFNGTIMRFFGYQPSGNPATVLVNGLVNGLLFRVFFYLNWLSIHRRTPPVGIFRQYVRCGFVGDDSLCAVDPVVAKWFNMVNFSAWLKSIGITYTMPDKVSKIIPHVPLGRASICKRSFRVVPTCLEETNVSYYVNAPIEIDSILKSWHNLHHRQENEWLVVSNNIIQGLRELARHPKDQYVDIQSRLIRALVAANAPKIPEVHTTWEEWQIDIERRHFLCFGKEDENEYTKIIDACEIFS